MAHIPVRLHKSATLAGASETGSPSASLDPADETSLDSGIERAKGSAPKRGGKHRNGRGHKGRFFAARSRRPGHPSRSSGISTAVDSLAMAFGQGRVDPFDVYPVKRVPAFVHEILDHALKHTWPNVYPASPLGPNPVLSAWMRCTMSSSLTFYSFVFSAAQHLLYLQGGQHSWNRKLEVLATWYQTRALQLISTTLNGCCDTLAPDALLISILSQAGTGQLRKSDRALRPIHPPSPLARAQDLDYRGQLVFGTTHLQAIKLLVEKRGGIDKIEIFGLADTMAFGELMGNTFSVTAPVFPCRWKWPASIKQILPEDETSTYLTLVTFNFSSTHSASHVKNLMDTIYRSRALVRALTLYVTDPCLAPAWLDLIHARNVLQHQLLSLPAFEGLVSYEASMYDACRLSALIFSDIAFFPFPLVAGVKPMLATKLRKTLEWCAVHGFWESKTHVMLWVATLGAIAASDTPDHEWYMGKIKFCLRTLNIHRFDAYSNWMNVFLWWSYICRIPLKNIWEAFLRSDPETAPDSGGPSTMPTS